MDINHFRTLVNKLKEAINSNSNLEIKALHKLISAHSGTAFSYDQCIELVNLFFEAGGKAKSTNSNAGFNQKEKDKKRQNRETETTDSSD